MIAKADMIMDIIERENIDETEMLKRARMSKETWHDILNGKPVSVRRADQILEALEAKYCQFSDVFMESKASIEEDLESLIAREKKKNPRIDCRMTLQLSAAITKALVEQAEMYMCSFEDMAKYLILHQLEELERSSKNAR